MKSNRLEAFSDGVLAIIITIMVLELKVPHGGTLESLKPLIPILLSYVLSFIYVGIYWNNHHHMFQAIQEINGAALWANLHLLFWLSLTPFVTSWMGENGFATWPVALYGFVLLMSAIAFMILQGVLLRNSATDSVLSRAIGSDFKGKISLAFYLVAIGVAFWNRWAALALYFVVAFIWFIPDSRIEKSIEH